MEWAFELYVETDVCAFSFNSFTQNLCVNDAVVKEDQKSATEADLRQEYNPDETSQIVSYSSRFVDHASEVMDAMNISGTLCAYKYFSCLIIIERTDIQTGSVHIKLPGLGEGGGSACQTLLQVSLREKCTDLDQLT